MWFLEVQAELTRNWLAAAEAATKACLETSQSLAATWAGMAAPRQPGASQLAFPFTAPIQAGAGFPFNSFAQAPFAQWPFVQLPWLAPFLGMPHASYAAPFDWQRLWMQPPWMAGVMPGAFSGTFPWAWPGFGISSTQSLADLMSASYRTAGGHAAAAVIMAPFQLKPAVTGNWFGWPPVTHRSYLN